MKRFVGALHRYQSIKSAQWADIYVRVLASQGSSKPNSKCIIYYFQWFFSTDKTIYNLLSLWTVLTLAEIQKSWRSYKKSCVIRFAIDIWSAFLITMLFFLSLKKLLLKMATSKTWTRTLKNLDPKKSGPWKA